MPAFSAIMGDKAAENASRVQQEAAQYAAEIEWKMYKQARADLMPFLQAGYKQIPYQTKALANYVDLIRRGPGSFEKSPYAKTLRTSMDEAASSIERQAAARGRGTATYGKSLTDYGLGKAAEQRGNWINEWLQTKLNPTGNVAQVGQNPYQGFAPAAANLAMGMGQDLASLNLYSGQADASGYLGRAQALQAGMAGGANMMFQGIGAMGGGYGGGGGGGGFGGGYGAGGYGSGNLQGFQSNIGSWDQWKRGLR